MSNCTYRRVEGTYTDARDDGDGSSGHLSQASLESAKINPLGHSPRISAAARENRYLRNKSRYASS